MGQGVRHMPYTLAKCEVPSGLGAHEIEAEKLAGIVRSVIEQEGPIHRDEIARRIAFLFGKRRPGSRIAEAVERALNLLQSEALDLCHDAGFWCTQEQNYAQVVRDRSAAPASLRKPEMISVSEIGAAILIARQQHPRPGDSELPTAVARLLGVAVTPKFRNLMHSLADLNASFPCV